MVGVVSSMLETKTWRKYRGEYYHHLLEYHGAKATVFLAVLLSTGLISCGDVDDDVRRTAFYRIIRNFRIRFTIARVGYIPRRSAGFSSS